MIIHLEITAGDEGRLKRLMELKHMNETDAIQYAISAAWMLAEHAAERRKKVRS